MVCLRKTIAVTDSIDLVAGIVVLVFVLMESEGKSALRILLHFFGRKRNAEKRSEEATDIMGDIAAVDMAYKRGDL